MSAEMTAETMVIGDVVEWDGSGVGGTQDAFLDGSGAGSCVGDKGIGDGGWKGTVLKRGGAEESMRAISLFSARVKFELMILFKKHAFYIYLYYLMNLLWQSVLRFIIILLMLDCWYWLAGVG